MPTAYALPIAVLLCLQAAASAAPFAETGRGFPVSSDRVQKGWVQGPFPRAEEWAPGKQEDLASALDQAPILSLADVAPAPRRVSHGHNPYLVPNPDGLSWDMVNPYRKKYLDQGQVVVHDFGSSETRTFTFGTPGGENLITPHRTDFHMKTSFFLAGKLVFPLNLKDRGLLLLVYDPLLNDFTHKIIPFGDPKFELFSIADGPDGKLYGMGQDSGRDGFIPFRFDPATGETKIFPKTAGGQKNPFPYYRDSALSGDWLYTKYGNAPWNLVAYNFRSGAFRHLATTKAVKGDHTTIRLNRCVGGVSCVIKEGDRIEGIDSFDGDEFPCWLVDGRIVPRVNDLAPWSGKPTERTRPPPYQNRFREFQRWPDGITFASAPPEIEKGRCGPIDADGNVALPYRLNPDAPWRHLRYKVKLYPGIVRRLAEVNDRVLFATDEGYGEHLLYDLEDRRLKRHLVQHVSPYAVGVFDNAVVVSGYPNFKTVVYDLKKLPSLESPAELGYFGSDTGTHSPIAGLARGADGTIYMAGTTYGRRRDGGGLAWFNRRTGAKGSVTTGPHRIFWLTSADDGRYVVLSSKSDEGSRLFCWDTRTKAFRYDIPAPGGGHAGPIEEVWPGLVLGHASGNEGLLYGLEAKTGKILWTRPVPRNPVTSFSQVRRHAYSFRRGPNGFVWATFEHCLVRIDPRDARVHPVGKIDPAQIAFARDSVFMAGGSHLRRIKNLEARGLPGGS